MDLQVKQRHPDRPEQGSHGRDWCVKVSQEQRSQVQPSKNTSTALAGRLGRRCPTALALSSSSSGFQRAGSTPRVRQLCRGSAKRLRYPLAPCLCRSCRRAAETAEGTRAAGSLGLLPAPPGHPRQRPAHPCKDGASRLVSDRCTLLQLRLQGAFSPLVLFGHQLPWLLRRP